MQTKRTERSDLPLLATGDLAKIVSVSPRNLSSWLDRGIAPFLEIHIGGRRIARAFGSRELEIILVMCLLCEEIGIEPTLARAYADRIVAAVGKRRPQAAAERMRYLALGRDAERAAVTLAGTAPVSETKITGAAVLVDLSAIQDRLNKALLAFADAVDPDDIVAEVLPRQ